MAGFRDDYCFINSAVLLPYLFQRANEVQFIPRVDSSRDKIHLSCQVTGLEMLLISWLASMSYTVSTVPIWNGLESFP